MKWEYTISTNTIWASFDYGEVEAESYDEALELAKSELKQNFDKANRAFNNSNVNGNETLGFRIEFDEDQIQIKPKK